MIKQRIKTKISYLMNMYRLSRVGAQFGRSLCLRNVQYINCAKSVRIKDYFRIECYDEFAGKKLSPLLQIEEGVIIGYYFTALVANKLTIRRNTIIASHVLITTENHGMNPESSIPYHAQELFTAPVVIGEGCWIGENVTILPGVNIGTKCIIGSGSIVTVDVPDYSIAVGIPAKVIKKYDFDLHEWRRLFESNKQ